jgi:uncharacterized protein YbaP (TraB family)
MPKFMLASALAAALAFAALPAAAEPALWKVTGPHATIYLFGTVHVLKKQTVWRSPKIDQAFASAGTLIEEIKGADDTAAMQPLVMKYGIDAVHPLSSKLDDAGKAKLGAAEASLGLPGPQLEALRPWMAALTFSLVPLVKAGYDPKSGVDIILKDEAAAAGKPLEAFETAEQQVRFFADLPQDQEVEYLLSTLDEVSKGTTQLDALVDAWAAGDVQTIETLMNGDIKDRYPKLYRILLVDRNQAFAVRIKQLLAGEGTYFVAVGAAHLAGPDSIQADLTRMGVAVARQ